MQVDLVKTLDHHLKEFFVQSLNTYNEVQFSSQFIGWFYGLFDDHVFPYVPSNNLIGKTKMKLKDYYDMVSDEERGFETQSAFIKQALDSILEVMRISTPANLKEILILSETYINTIFFVGFSSKNEYQIKAILKSQLSSEDLFKFDFYDNFYRQYIRKIWLTSLFEFYVDRLEDLSAAFEFFLKYEFEIPTSDFLRVFSKTKLTSWNRDLCKRIEQKLFQTTDSVDSIIEREKMKIENIFLKVKSNQFWPNIENGINNIFENPFMKSQVNKSFQIENVFTPIVKELILSKKTIKTASPIQLMDLQNAVFLLLLELSLFDEIISKGGIPPQDDLFSFYYILFIEKNWERTPSVNFPLWKDSINSKYRLFHDTFGEVIKNFKDDFSSSAINYEQIKQSYKDIVEYEQILKVLYFHLTDLVNRYSLDANEMGTSFKEELRLISDQLDAHFVEMKVKEKVKELDSPMRVKKLVIKFLRENDSSVLSDEQLENYYQILEKDYKLVQQIATGELMMAPYLPVDENDTITGDFTNLVVCQIKAMERYLKDVLVNNIADELLVFNLSPTEGGPYLSIDKVKYPVYYTSTDTNDYQYIKEKIKNFSNQSDWFSFKNFAFLSSTLKPFTAENLSSDKHVKPKFSIEIGNVMQNIQFHYQWVSKSGKIEDPNSIFYHRKNNNRCGNDCKFYEKWVQTVRNGHLHIHEVRNIQEARRIRSKTSGFFIKCLDELKDI